MNLIDVQNRITKTDYKNEKLTARFYEYNGEKYISVTTVLNIINKEKMNFARHRSTKEEWDKKTQLAANLGTKLHDLVQQDCEGKAPIVIPELEKAFANWIETKKKYSIVPLHNEIKVISEVFKYAGQVDLVAKLEGSQDEWVLDIKSGYYDKSHGYQLAAYVNALRESTGKNYNMAILHIKRDGSQVALYPYTHIDSCLKAFLCALDLYKLNHYKELEQVGYPHWNWFATEKYYMKGTPCLNEKLLSKISFERNTTVQEDLFSLSK